LTGPIHETVVVPQVSSPDGSDALSFATPVSGVVAASGWLVEEDAQAIALEATRERDTRYLFTGSSDVFGGRK
jgi:hypothetical protein